MKWVVFLCFILISFTALATEYDSPSKEKQHRSKKVNFRSLASVNAEVEHDIIQERDESLLDKEQRRFLYEKENWEKTLDFMEKNSWNKQR
jgi:Flp pilus assembly protein TadB